LYLKNILGLTMKAGVLFFVAAAVLGACSNHSVETSDTASGTAMGSRYTKFSSWCAALPLLQRSTNSEDLASAKTVLALMTRAAQFTGNFSISCTEADNFLSNDKVIFLARLGLTSVRPLAVVSSREIICTSKVLPRDDALSF
jgi:hypothetical protein